MQLRIRYEPVAENTRQVVERIDPSLFRSMSFGQLPSAIDWVFLKCIQDQGIDHVKKGEHLQVYYDLDVLTDLDNRFFYLYTMGANLLAVIHDDGPGAVSLLLKGESFRLNELKSYPQSFRDSYWSQEWQIPLLLAYNYLFELDDLPDAAKSYEEASQFPQSPEYLRGLVKDFHSKDGLYSVGLRVLTFMIKSQKDPLAREKLEDKKRSIEVSLYLADINKKLEAFASQRKIDVKKESSRVWRDFLVEGGASETDPWSGSLSINSDGKIITSTEHHKVLGLE